MFFKRAVFVASLYLLASKANAMPWGRVSEGVIVAEGDSPALCVPRSALVGLSVGVAYVADVKNQIHWIARSKQGGEPVFLQPGQCLKHAFFSPEYESEKRGGSLKFGAKYIFSLDSLHKTKTRSEVFSYSAFFCLERSSSGAVTYAQVGRRNVDVCK